MEYTSKTDIETALQLLSLRYDANKQMISKMQNNIIKVEKNNERIRLDIERYVNLRKFIEEHNNGK